MVDSKERIAWIVVFTVLVALAIPWFRWGEGTVVAGLPDWIWWHIVWMIVAAAVFYVFADRAWGVWIEKEEAR